VKVNILIISLKIFTANGIFTFNYCLSHNFPLQNIESRFCKYSAVAMLPGVIVQPSIGRIYYFELS